MDIIVGTAGHIDHGKTALVRALTGTDTDRLPEEKKRGITIDIGFAEMETENFHFGFVDVPGHERFVKNMLAGASGIDLVLLVIAADEGVMPQTREHFEICRLLGLKRGIVVLTKSDLVDDETLELARLDAAELVAGSFLESAPLVAVSSVSGKGVDELKAELMHSAAQFSSRSSAHVGLLPIDRTFTVKGFGAVVTGTLVTGEISDGAEMELLPSGRRVRVRGLQTHGRPVKTAHAGQRTAVNIAGIDHSEVSRGMLLAEPGVISATQIIDSAIEMLESSPRPLRTRQRVRVHIGTAEVFARVLVLNETGEVAPGESGYVQLRLESATASYAGERFIIRSYSPQRTIGGGQVVIPVAVKHRKRDITETREFLRKLALSFDQNAAFVRLIVMAAGAKGVSVRHLRSQTGWTEAITKASIAAAADSIEQMGDLLIGSAIVSMLMSNAGSTLANFHRKEPLAAGMPRETFREQAFGQIPNDLIDAVVVRLTSEGKIVAEKELVRLAAHRTDLSPDESAFANRLLATLKEAKFEPPKIDEAIAASIGNLRPADAKKLIVLKLRSGEMIKVTDDHYFAASAIDELKAAVRSFAETSSDRVIDVAKFKEIAGVSRKYAIPLLEYFDRERVTVRAGDKRVVLK